jgi:hypothetical protein
MRGSHVSYTLPLLLQISVFRVSRGGDVVESLSSQDFSASSPSWLSSASGASELAGAGSAWIGLPREDEDEELKLDGSTKEHLQKYISKTTYNTRKRRIAVDTFE